jgi:hypothetical protein
MASRQPLPVARVLLEDLYRHCRGAIGHCQRLAQRERRKAKVFVQLAAGAITPSEYQARIQSLANAHEQHLDAGVEELNDLLQYLDPVVVAQSNERINSATRSASAIFADMASNPESLDGIHEMFVTLLEGWNQRLELLQDLSNRLAEAIQSGEDGADTRADSSGKSARSFPRNPEIVAVYLYIEQHQGSGKSQNVLIQAFMDRGASTSFAALRRGLSRYRAAMRPRDDQG